MKKAVSIHIGEFYASKTPTVIHTLLGSCVAVCLFDPVRRIGGMNHILLPGKADFRSFDALARYGANAMELLINSIMGLGGNRRQLIAKVFGGSHMLQAISIESGAGRKNAEFVIEFLRVEDIKINSRDLGGQAARKIYFHSDSGDVFLKRIYMMQHTKIISEEQKTLKRIKKEIKKPGNVTLFYNSDTF